MIRIVASLLIASFISSCGTTSEEPQLNLKPIINGLDVNLTGSVIDPDSSIAKVIIDWGDNSIVANLVDGFDEINESHTYADKGIFEVLATAIDSTGDSTLVTYSIEVSFLETSLEGVNTNLYKNSENELLFLTLNLHTYQEDNQNEKLNMIVDVIGGMDIDFIAFQECAQHKTAGIIDNNIREDNMTHRIAEMLNEKFGSKYSFSWDWAHYGWNVWEEGVSVLSKYPLIETDSRYVSASTTQSNIESRKVIYGAFQFDDKRIHLFSAHTHWRTSETSEEQNNQIKKIKSMVVEKEAENAFSFVAGDFNVNPTSDYPWSEGYNIMVNGGEYTDTYLIVNTDANNKPAQSKYHTVLGDFLGRIDYVFMKNNTVFKVEASQIIFTSEAVGKVSDHYGVLTRVSLK